MTRPNRSEKREKTFARWGLISLCSVLGFWGCKTSSDVREPSLSTGMTASTKSSIAGIYSCSDVLQESTPSPSHPLAGLYVITAFGDSATLTWMADHGKHDVHEADCRVDDELHLTTCETYTEFQRKAEPQMSPIWAFTIDHTRENDVRVLGYNGTYAAYQKSGKPMEFLGVIHQCADESKR